MASASVYFNESHRNSEQQRSCMGVCVCASVRVRTSVHACVRDVFAIYDDNILSRLIIIKIIILYFIQIRHTDDSPQRVYRLVPLIYSSLGECILSNIQ